MEQNRLYRNKKEAWIGGVAAGIADYFGIDPIIIRVIFLVLIFAVGGGVLVYVVLWIAVPEKIDYFNQDFNQTSRTEAPPSVPEDDKSGSWDQRTKGSLVGGIILICLGMLFLLRQFIPAFSFEKLWPVLLIVVGVLVVFTGFLSKKQK